MSKSGIPPQRRFRIKPPILAKHLNQFRRMSCGILQQGKDGGRNTRHEFSDEFKIDDRRTELYVSGKIQEQDFAFWVEKI